jgi:hypothetical protein
MAEITENVNWIAVTVGAVLAFLLGWLWYSPKLFGTKWAEGAGVTSRVCGCNGRYYDCLPGDFLIE